MPARARKRDEKRDVKQLERLVELQSERIERLSKAKFKFPSSPRRVSTGAAFYRVTIPDTHGCYADKDAVASLLRDLKMLSKQVREIVMLGDHIDCGGFLAQHHTIGYVAEAEYTFEQDVAAANALLDAVQSACPKARIYYLEGNHERRLERWVVSQALRNHSSAKYLSEMFCTESVLDLEKRGIHYFKQGRFYMGLRIPSTIRLGRCHFTHGSRTGESAAKKMLHDFGSNVVFGHIHRMASHVSRTVKEGEIGAWSPGCLCGLQPLWNHTQITGWSHGYGLQLVRSDGDFLHINVPIIDGKSYLMQLTGRR